MRPRDMGLALLAMMVFGLNFVVVKIGLEQLPPLTFMALRFFLVAALLVPFVPVPWGRLRELYGYSVSLGVVHFALIFGALPHVDAAVAAIAIQIQVPFAALLAVLFFKDRIGWRPLFGMAVSIAGVAILAGEPRAGSPLWAVAMVVLAALVWAVSNIQVKRLADLGSLQLNAWMALFATPQLVVLSLLLEDGQMAAVWNADGRAYAAVAYQAVVIVILGYGIWYRLLARYPVSQAMPWTLLVPVFGVLSGVLFLGEPVTGGLVIGGVLTVCGVAVIVVRRPRAVSSGGPVP